MYVENGKLVFVMPNGKRVFADSQTSPSLAKGKLLELATKCARDRAASNDLELYLQMLASDGWTRKMIYRLVLSALRDSPPEQVENVLKDYLGTLDGSAALEPMIRFSGEPVDERHFLDYVRSKSWLE